MPSGSVSQNIASQVEYLRDTLEELVLLQGVLWKRINKATDIKAVSNRPARIPFNVLTGGIFRTGANLFDGQDLGQANHGRFGHAMGHVAGEVAGDALAHHAGD